MTDQLIAKIRDHAVNEPVPDLDLAGVVSRGRKARRRRSVARRGTVIVALGLLAASSFIVGGHGDDGGRLQASTSITARDVGLVSSAYRAGGAFSRGDTLWFSDPEYAVDLGVKIQLMYYTAQGVIAGVANDDAGDVKRDYLYVGTDGTVRDLELPGDVVPGADAQADRFAYVTPADHECSSGPGGATCGTAYRVHVAQASTGRELASVLIEATFTWGGWDLPPVSLSGDFVVLGVDGAQRVVNWRTGERVADVPGQLLPSTGGGRALGGDLSAVTYRLGDSVPLRSTMDLAVPMGVGGPPWESNALSPDGRFVLTTTTFVEVDEKAGPTGDVFSPDGEVVRHPVVHVTDVVTGHRIALPGGARTYGWTPDGRLMRVDGRKVSTCDGSTGACTSRTMPAGRGAIKIAGVYLGS